MSRPRIARLLSSLALLAASLLASGPAAAAVEWESLVMPGPVIGGHAKTEKDCKACHVPFARDEQRGQCLACHEDVQKDVEGGRGFHGRNPPASTGQCRNCHTDHKGRDADIVRLDPQSFNHDLTDFVLEGGHRGPPCSACHKPGVAHREAPGTCIGCHAGRDVHRKALGEDCASCHTVTRWQATQFDHSRATAGRYPLTGAHADVDCGLCHAGQRFKDTPTTCVACHRIDDVHAGSRGAGCQDCHDTADWKQATFDHARETGFPLSAGHAGQPCSACHTGNDFKKTAGRDCVACHRSDDIHQGRNGAACQDCHGTKNWQEARFDHDRETQFALAGAHGAVGCVACHKAPAATVRLDRACVACHRDDDPHAGALGTDCASCHGEESWQAGVRFDHDLTRFPLVGLHATAACEACHVDRRFRDTPGGCVDCHREDDAHGGNLGTECSGCHTPNDWRIWTFDHDRQTRFALDGAHAPLDCVACHSRPPGDGRGPGRECAGCHRRDDVHGGQFGADCARCHNTRSFAGARRVP